MQYALVTPTTKKKQSFKVWRLPGLHISTIGSSWTPKAGHGTTKIRAETQQGPISSTTQNDPKSTFQCIVLGPWTHLQDVGFTCTGEAIFSLLVPTCAKYQVECKRHGTYFQGPTKPQWLYSVAKAGQVQEHKQENSWNLVFPLINRRPLPLVTFLLAEIYLLSGTANVMSQAPGSIPKAIEGGRSVTRIKNRICRGVRITSITIDGSQVASCNSAETVSCKKG